MQAAEGSASGWTQEAWGLGRKEGSDITGVSSLFWCASCIEELPIGSHDARDLHGPIHGHAGWPTCHSWSCRVANMSWLGMGASGCICCSSATWITMGTVRDGHGV